MSRDNLADKAVKAAVNKADDFAQAQAVARVMLDHERASAVEFEKAILMVMAEVDYAQKTVEVKQGSGYMAAGERDIIRALRPSMVKNGLSLRPEVTEVVKDEIFKGKSGPMNRVMVRVTWRVVHAPSGYSATIQTPGEGIDSGDKGTAKAMTNALKYALRQLFILETGIEPDETPSSQQERAADEPAETRAGHGHPAYSNDRQFENYKRTLEQIRRATSHKQVDAAIDDAREPGYVNDDNWNRLLRAADDAHDALNK